MLQNTLQKTPALCAALLIASAGWLWADEEANSPRWLGPDDTSLPFQSEQELLAYFLAANVDSFKEITSGINTPYKLRMELDGLRVNVIFRNVYEEKHRAGTPASMKTMPEERDSYDFEVAAYKLSRLLGIDNVPPACEYEWRGQKGSVQLWVENATPESVRIQRKEAPADAASWHLQRNRMKVFDNLIYNYDRNHGNMLLDARGKLWFIDHTRSFKKTAKLETKDDIVVVDRELWRRLQDLDPNEVKRTLDPHLNYLEMQGLLKRHQLLLRHVEGLIDERGENQVLLSSE